MVKTIIFDLGEVYIRGLLGVERALKPLLGLTEKEIYKMLRPTDRTDFFHGKITEEEYISKVIKKNNWKLSTEQVKGIIRENFVEIEGTREIIEKLKSHGFQLGLLSVHGREWIEHCNNKYGYHKLFHSTLYSFENGISKPDRGAYEGILKRLGAKPQDCLFIDDKEENLLAAEKIGIKTILFKNAEQLKRDLRNFSIAL